MTRGPTRRNGSGQARRPGSAARRFASVFLWDTPRGLPSTPTFLGSLEIGKIGFQASFLGLFKEKRWELEIHLELFSPTTTIAMATPRSDKEKVKKAI
jgi:hypothetical protein